MTLTECRTMARRDFLSIDALESVTYFHRLQNDTFPENGTVTQALWGSGSRRNSGQAVGADVSIQLDAVPLAAVYVGPMGRVVRADGSKWSIVRATQENWGTLWVLDLVKETADG
jgi:hypothetical protein